MHKIRLLCGSIAVTIATHKNSKIQRLSEFFLMRIGACFATLAILSYTKIIDNNWYLRHLFSYFLLGIQWGRKGRNEGFNKVSISLPITVPGKSVVVLFSPESSNEDGRTSEISASGYTDHIEINQSVALSINWCAICR